MAFVSRFLIYIVICLSPHQPALAPPSQRNSHRHQQWLAVGPTDLVSSAGSCDSPACLEI